MEVEILFVAAVLLTVAADVDTLLPPPGPADAQRHLRSDAHNTPHLPRPDEGGVLVLSVDVVTRLHVLSHLVVTTETPPAFIAFERLLTGVNEKMLVQVTFLLKTFVTVVTSVSFSTAASSAARPRTVPGSDGLAVLWSQTPLDLDGSHHCLSTRQVLL